MIYLTLLALWLKQVVQLNELQVPVCYLFAEKTLLAIGLKTILQQVSYPYVQAY